MKTRTNPNMAILLKANGQIEYPEPKNGTDFSLEEAQGAVGGYVETLPIAGKRGLMLVNEEGLLQFLPPNKAATVIAGQLIVGDALVIRRDQFR